MPPVSSAIDVTVRQTLELLDGPFAPLAEGVAEDRYALWLGSGISLGRLEGLRKLVPRVLDFLQRRVVAGDPDCRFRKALLRALALSKLTPAELATIDPEQPISEWPPLDSLVNRLVNDYARFLDVEVDGEQSDYLLWHGVDVTFTYANPAIEPDSEHICIAILILEGVASDLPTANWDGLIERAVNELTQGRDALTVCVAPEDLRLPQLQSRLYKFHGCAVRAAQDEAKYRRRLIARQSQINAWTANAENEPIKNHLIHIALTKPTLMVGLSAQDGNIQGLFAEAAAQMAWPWPSNPPAYAFSEDELGFDQTILLRNVYQAAYTAATRHTIYESALIRAFAKSLLGALVLHVLCRKIRGLIAVAPGTLQNADREDLYAGAIFVRNRIAEVAHPITAEFVRRAVGIAARLMAMFREGTAAHASYHPLTSRSVQHIAGDISLPGSGLSEFAVAVGLLGLGARAGAWSIQLADLAAPRPGGFRVETVTGPTNVFVAANANAAMRLEVNGHVTPSDDAIVIHSLPIPPAMPRSPRGALGRSGRSGVRSVSIGELLNEAANTNDLLQRFREALAI
jgi:SIR2-like domain